MKREGAINNFARVLSGLPPLDPLAPPSIWENGEFWWSYWRQVVSLTRYL